MRAGPRRRPAAVGAATGQVFHGGAGDRRVVGVRQQLLHCAPLVALGPLVGQLGVLRAHRFQQLIHTVLHEEKNKRSPNVVNRSFLLKDLQETWLTTLLTKVLFLLRGTFHFRFTKNIVPQSKMPGLVGFRLINSSISVKCKITRSNKLQTVNV